MTHNVEYADWFPHPSPDGKQVVFLSYDRSVEGHPANKDVVLRMMPSKAASRAWSRGSSAARHDQRAVVVARQPAFRIRELPAPGE